MQAVRLMTGRGGWPMTTWLTPDRRPFFGGTYFPARDGDRGAHKGFLTLLRELEQSYDEQPDRASARAQELTRHIRSSLIPRAGSDLPGPESIEKAMKAYEAAFDESMGGLRGAPKFPGSLPVRLLLRYHRRTGSERVLRMATLTLDKMAAGGMYDQLGGGFHRYSTAAAWRVPHLYALRQGRRAPSLDAKILTAWNGLMISAFARAGFVFDEPRFVAAAGRAADFLLTHPRVEGGLLRVYTDGRARFNGYVDDYAFLIAALLDRYETTSDLRWLAEAVSLQARLERHHADREGGGYFMTSGDHETLQAREKPAYDGAEPSGNSVAAMNLLRLHELTSNDRYRSQAEDLMRGFGSSLRVKPRALPEMFLALDFHLDAPKAVVIVVPESRSEAEPFLSVLRRTFLPNRVLIVAARGAELDRQTAIVPLLEGKVARHGKATAYVCRQRACLLPTSDVGSFVEQLER